MLICDMVAVYFFFYSGGIQTNSCFKNKKVEPLSYLFSLN